jgi:hypothetical protein
MLKESFELYLMDRGPDNLSVLKTQAAMGGHRTTMNPCLLGPSYAE